MFTLRHLGIWDVIYEHCSYFSPASLARCFELAGFKVSAVAEEYGGQFLCIDAVPVDAPVDTPDAHRDDVAAMTQDVERYAQVYEDKIVSWRKRLADWRQQGQRAVLWGSGSKGVTFLNLLKGDAQIEYVADINPRKHGIYVTGAGQQVIAPEFLTKYRPGTVIVMNPIYMDEVRAMVADLGIEADVVEV